MGQALPKVYIVNIDQPSNPDQGHFNSIQEAIDFADYGSTIVLSAGDHTGPDSNVIRMKSNIHFIGLQGSKITSKIVGETTGVIFDNVVFRNVDNQSIEFRDSKGYLFRNCEFQITLRESKHHSEKIRFGVHFVGGSALIQNSIFSADVEDINVFILLGADNDASYLSLQSPIVRVQYKNVCKLETFFFRGIKKSSVIPYFEAFSSSIHYRTVSCDDNVYDGHCCIKEKERRKCERHHCGRCGGDESDKCKKSHSCCDKKCKKCKVTPASIRLFRSLDCVNVSLIGTKFYFVQGKGLFNIAAGDAPVYINGLTVTATNGDKWEIGDFRNILLTSFMSNLKCASEIKECHFIENNQADDCSDSQSDESCDRPRRGCLPCPPGFNPALPIIPGSLPTPILPLLPPCSPCIPLPPSPPCPPPCPPPPCPPRWIKCKEKRHGRKHKKHAKDSTDDSASNY